MNNSTNHKVLTKIRKIFRPMNIYRNLKILYGKIIPKGSPIYKITHGFLSIFLKRFHFFNIAYQEWIRKIDRYSKEDLKSIQHKIEIMPVKPQISVLMPVYNPPLSLLEEAIQSVINQIYPHWELCIADDASTNLGVKILIQAFMQKDPRIKAVFRTENGHISAASNSALAIVSNPYLALLDHDDVLHPHALYYVAQTISAHLDYEIIYSDEDKITKRGRRVDPYFKPDFNYELLLGHNMVSHLGVYRTETMRAIGGFREGLEGSQDYDLLLRIFERTKPHQIHHIPFPLYHWRISRESAAEDLNVKPYAIEAGKRALQEHLNRTSTRGKVRFSPELAAYRVDYPLPEPLPSVAILIRDQTLSQSLINCVNAILESTHYPNYIIKLVLPLSTQQNIDFDGLSWGDKVSTIFVNDEISDDFAKSINTAIASLSEDYAMVLDKSLVLFPPNWLNIMIGQASQAEIGAVAPKLLYQNDVVYSCGVVLLPTGEARHMFKGEEQAVNGYFGWAKLTRGYSGISEKCLLFKRNLFDQVDGFSDNFDTTLYTAVDLCLKLKQIGVRNVVISSIELYTNEIHHYNLTPEFPPDALRSDQIIFKDKWEKWVENDPAFNLNLTIIDEGKLTVELSPKYRLPGKQVDENF